MRPDSTIPSGLCQCGCGMPTKHRFAQGHNRKVARFTSIPEDKYVVVGTCWIWLGATTQPRRAGVYGKIRQGGKDMPAHRWAYTMRYGAIPDGLHIDHLCRNTMCINPDHLEAVTQQVNTQRSKKLNPDVVRAIRASDALLREIAERFGVSEATVSLVRRRKIWDNIE